GEFIIVAEHDRNVVIAADLEEFLVAEAFVARFDDVAKRNAVEPLRQELQKCCDVLTVELPPGGEHPQERTKLAAERGHALSEIGLEALAGIGELWPGDDVARALDRELETFGNLLLPRGPAFRALAAVESRVDLDRSELPRRIFELTLLRQAGGIEGLAPRRERPAADADADFTYAHRPAALCSSDGRPQHRDADRCRRFGRKRPCDLSRSRRAVGGPSSRGCRHSRGVPARSGAGPCVLRCTAGEARHRRAERGTRGARPARRGVAGRTAPGHAECRRFARTCRVGAADPHARRADEGVVPALQRAIRLERADG